MASDTAFTRRVLAVVRRIPVGRVTTYGTVAKLAGKPRAARAVGNIMAEARQPGLPYQWQYSAVHADQVPAAVAQAAAGFTIAVIDTGADLGAPDLSAKTPQTYSVRKRLADVPDANGHGTFVAALAAGSSTNGQRACMRLRWYLSES